jgi:CRISPR-associated protein Cas1
MMKTLFIDRKQVELSVESGRLMVRYGDARMPFSVPTRILEMLVISAPVQFSSSLVTQLTQENVVIVFINPRKSEASSMTTGMMHNDARRRLWQYQALTHEKLRLEFAKALMQHKLRLQKAVLTRALLKRLDCRPALFTGVNRIQAQLDQLMTVANIDSLRGMEGAAGAAYFEAFQQLFAPSLGFNGRNRRPPRDPVNVILSLTFTLLHAEAVRCLFAVGFDPLLGIYHEPCFGRESLACDLVELFRPLAERWIWRLFAEEVVRLEYFVLAANTEKPCLLGKRGREVFYAEYDQAARSWRRLMRRTARHWLARLQLALVDQVNPLVE